VSESLNVALVTGRPLTDVQPFASEIPDHQLAIDLTDQTKVTRINLIILRLANCIRGNQSWQSLKHHATCASDTH
jgi:hypothetical protein